MLKVSEIFIYPIKSLGGISVQSAVVEERGFRNDRRWLLVDEQNIFMTQREFPQMSLLQTAITDEDLMITHKKNGSGFRLPLSHRSQDRITVQIWNDLCLAHPISEEADKWFSEMLSFKCRLVFMSEDTRRHVEQPYAKNNEITSFSDAYPFLIIGQSTLDDLNRRLKDPVPMNRFRPNIVFTGGDAFEEDGMEHFTINEMDFYGVKPCARCVITTVDQEKGTKAKEPLKTLSEYRLKDNKVFFGQNLLHKGTGIISVGDELITRIKANYTKTVNSF